MAKHRLLSFKGFLRFIAITFTLVILSLNLALPAQAATIYLYMGPDTTKDGLQLTDFEITSPSAPWLGDSITVNFNLSNRSKNRIVFGRVGIFVAARDPQGRNRDFGHTYQGKTLEPGGVMTLKATTMLDEAGIWTFWPTYYVERSEHQAEHYGPYNWHSAHLYIPPLTPVEPPEPPPALPPSPPTPVEPPAPPPAPPTPAPSPAPPTPAPSPAPPTLAQPPTSAPSPAPVDIANIVDVALESLLPGLMIYNPPEEMMWRKNKRVQLSISREKCTEGLAQELLRRGLPYKEIEVGPLMTAKLWGGNFYINVIGDENKPVGPTGYTEWEWDVMPLEKGWQELTLIVQVRIYILGEVFEHKDVCKKDSKVYVRANLMDIIIYFLENNWKWLVGTIIALVGAVSAIIARRHRASIETTRKEP